MTRSKTVRSAFLILLMNGLIERMAEAEEMYKEILEKPFDFSKKETSGYRLR